MRSPTYFKKKRQPCNPMPHWGIYLLKYEMKGFVPSIETGELTVGGSVATGQPPWERDAVYLAFFMGESAAWNFPRSGSEQQWKN